MGTLQLVAQQRPGGSRELAVLPASEVDENQGTLEGVSPLDLGSQDLIELAHHLVEAGWRVLEVSLADAHLDTSRSSEAANETVAAHLNGPNVDQLIESFQYGNLRGLYLLHVRLRSPQHDQFLFSQSGVVQAYTVSAEGALRSALNVVSTSDPAWSSELLG